MSAWNSASEGMSSSTPALKCEWYLSTSAANVVMVEKTSSTGQVMKMVSAPR